MDLNKMEHTIASGVEALAYWNEKQALLADFQLLQEKMDRKSLVSIRGPEPSAMV